MYSRKHIQGGIFQKFVDEYIFDFNNLSDIFRLGLRCQRSVFRYRLKSE